ncbi:MAG: LysE family translocator, partial [Planktomarina sp.]|uniref:LysE family translocator n=1 Tax=Planktomarina sp. TaxID=2024851 RepID=UPI003C43DD78
MIWEILWGFEPALITGFVIAGLILNITPGADFLYIMSSGLSGGSRIGVAAALGVNLGVVVHILAAAAGLSALLFAHPAAYDLIRISGAAYLAWMAVQVWRRSSTVARARSCPGVRQAARRGLPPWHCGHVGGGAGGAVWHYHCWGGAATTLLPRWRAAPAAWPRCRCTRAGGG